MIIVTALRTHAAATKTEELVAGRVGMEAAFHFSPEWEGLGKTAVFEAGGVAKDVIIGDDPCIVPHECMIEGAELRVGIYGMSTDGTVVIPTVYALVGTVKKGADPSGDESYPPTPSVGEQLQSQIISLGERLDDLEMDGVGGSKVVIQPDEPVDAPVGTLWYDTNEEPGGCIELDTTLTQSGKAADAKAVGDALENLANDAANELTAAIGIVNPDMYEGTDSQKIQAAFDALATSGGIISINRIYTLSSSIYVRHNSSAHNNLITVAGDGKQAGIDFGPYCFQGADTSSRAYGGVIFKDLWLSGTNIGFDCTHLIRLTFDKCMIRNFQNFLYCTDCLQSVYIMGCYIRASSAGIADGSVRETINATTVADLKMIGCVAEQGYRLLDVTEKMDGCSITDCCIEGYKNTPIVLSPVNRSVNISNNYFESNQGTHIDLTRATSWCGVSIHNNWFCEYNGMESVGAVLLPTGISNGCLTVVGNNCPYSNSLLLKVPSGARDLSKVYAFSNVGATNDNSMVKMLTPKDINEFDANLEMGVDYWTEEDRAKAVNEVVALASGSERWVFTLASGATLERTVSVVSNASYSSEQWVFTLDDGSTITKAVSIA